MAEALDITEKKERNWVRVAYGFKFLKNGLANFIETQIHQQHDDLIRCLETDCTNPAKSCATCSSENLLPNHQTRQCIQKFRLKCFCSTWHNRRKCPNQFCSRFYDKIVFAQTEANPSWQNTDPTRWYSDYWELAKCFLGTTGYLATHSASETDVTGLLSIAINDIFVVNKINNLNNFKQVREIRNEIFHRKMLQVTDDEVSVYIDRMIDVLQDKHYLLRDVESCQAVDQLNKLKQNEIYISTEDADELRKNALTAISMIREVTEESKSEIEEAKRLTIRDIELKSNEIEEARLTTIRDIELKGSEIKTDLLNAVSCHTRTTDDDGSKAASESEIFEFKKELMNFYKNNESMIGASPLVEDHAVPLAKLYVQPPMSAYIKPNAFGQGHKSPEKTTVSSYRKLLFNDDNVPYKHIYVEANAGYGKTSFTQNIALTWCQPNMKDKKTVSKFVDVDTLQRFDLLFLLHLRDFQDDDMCLLDDLIIKFVAQSLPDPERFSKKFIKSVLRTRPCLVLCDGLDEWMHPSGKCAGKPGIPHNNYGDNCTVLTTTRPWKISTIGLTPNHIDHHLEISHLDEATSKELKSNAVKLLCENSGEKGRDLTDFDRKVSSVKVGYIRMIPYILLQLICIWFDGLSIGRSKCETYSNTIALTLQRGLNKKNAPTLLTGNAERNFTVPECMRHNVFCNQYMNLLLKLGKLAFYALFQKKKECSLVVEITTVLKFLTEQELEFCLKVGLLSQSKDNSKVSVKQFQVFFQHKSIQEFMAALYITSEWSNENIKSTILEDCSSLSSILEMENLFDFVCGMNPEVYTCISGELQPIVDLDSVTCTYRICMYIGDDDDYYNARRTMKSYQSMQLECLQESLRNGNESCPIPLYFVLDKHSLKYNIKALKSIMQVNESIGKSPQVSLNEKIIADMLSDSRPFVFMQLLYPGVFTSLETVVVEDCDKEPVWLVEILTESARSLKCLTLYPGYPGISVSDISITALTGLTCLHSLYLAWVNMTHSNLQCLYDYISQTTTLTQLKLKWIYCSDHEGEYRDCDVTLNLHRLNELKMLHLYEVPSRELHVNPACLEKLVFLPPWGEKMTARASATLWQDLRAAPVLSSLTLYRMISCHEMIQTIPTLTQLQHLKLERIDMGDIIPRLSPDMTHLECVVLYDVKMSSAAWKQLLISVGQLKHPVTVELDDCRGSRMDEWLTFMDEIKSTSTLSWIQDLDLSFDDDYDDVYIDDDADDDDNDNDDAAADDEDDNDDADDDNVAPDGEDDDHDDGVASEDKIC